MKKTILPKFREFVNEKKTDIPVPVAGDKYKLHHSGDGDGGHFEYLKIVEVGDDDVLIKISPDEKRVDITPETSVSTLELEDIFKEANKILLLKETKSNNMIPNRSIKESKKDILNYIYKFNLASEFLSKYNKLVLDRNSNIDEKNVVFHPDRIELGFPDEETRDKFMKNMTPYKDHIHTTDTAMGLSIDMPKAWIWNPYSNSW